MLHIDNKMTRVSAGKVLAVCASRRKMQVAGILLAFVICFWPFSDSCHAAEGIRSHFLAYGPGVAAAGLGETFTAAGDDISVVYYNPSLLTRLVGEEISANHWFLFDGARYNFIGFSSADEESAFAFAGTQFYRGNIEVREKIDDLEEKTENNQMAVYGSYAAVVNKLKLNYGLSLKWLHYSMYDENGDGLTVDIGLSKQLLDWSFSIGKKLTLNSGIILQNPVQFLRIKMDDYREDLPFAAKAGLSCSMTVFPRYNKKQDLLSTDEITLSGDVGRTENRSSYSYGMEYKLLKLMMFRAGYKQGFTAGLGLLLSDWQLDYAYMSKEFTNFHKIGFIYRFGRPEEPEPKMASTFVEEFQKVYQQASRVYERYYRDATTLTEQGKYQDAISLLGKAIPLKPSENGDAKQLLITCRQTVNANEVNRYVTEAKSNESKDNLTEAYTNYLRAFDIDPANANLKTFLTDIELRASQPMLDKTPAPPPQQNQETFYDVQKRLESFPPAAARPQVKQLRPEKAEIERLKNEYMQNIIKNIDAALGINDFTVCGKQLKKLELLMPESTEAKENKRKIADKKSLYTARFVISGMQYLKNNNTAEAYQYISEAEKLSPEDSSIKDQMEIIKSGFLSKRNFSMEDKLYADKLYYLAAYNFATDEKSLSTYIELKSFNPVHDYLPELENALIESGMIKRKEP